MKKIRVLQFPVANSKGGITQYVLQNWKFIDKSKFQFDFATMSKSLDFAGNLEEEGCKIYYISCYAELDKKRFTSEFKKILIEGSYDIVHIHTKQWKSFLVEQIAKDVGIKKIIIHAHNTGIDTLDEKKRIEEIKLHNLVLEKLTKDIATDFWACSKEAANFLFGDKISKSKIVIMKNAIDLSRYTYNLKTRNENRRNLGIAEDEYIIGNVGRFVYQKNQDFLIKVFSEIYRELGKNDCRYRLLLVGSGEREEEYRKMVNEYGLSNCVIFTGYRKDVPELLNVMDIFCLPSRFEGLGIVLVEAQATGLPCIVNQSVPEEVKITEDVVMLPLDISVWKRRIMKYYSNRTWRKENGKKILDAGYDISNQIKMVEQYYENGIIIK